MPTISFRLTDAEMDMLDKMCAGDGVGFANRTEFFRLILHREFNRRKRLGKPLAKDWQSDFRIGRPKKISLPARTQTEKQNPVEILIIKQPKTDSLCETGPLDGKII